MTLQADLRNATDRIIAARKTLANREFERLAFARNARQAKAALDTATVTLMSHYNAGSNDTARRAYATYETAAEREAAKAADNKLTEAEAAVLDATTDLRIAEDERRYLELVARMTIAGILDVSPARDTLAYATDADDARDDDNIFYNSDVAAAVARHAR